jgi:hypothetical protein
MPFVEAPFSFFWLHCATNAAKAALCTSLQQTSGCEWTIVTSGIISNYIWFLDVLTMLWSCNGSTNWRMCRKSGSHSWFQWWVYWSLRGVINPAKKTSSRQLGPVHPFCPDLPYTWVPQIHAWWYITPIRVLKIHIMLIRFITRDFVRPRRIVPYVSHSQSYILILRALTHSFESFRHLKRSLCMCKPCARQLFSKTESPDNAVPTQHCICAQTVMAHYALHSGRHVDSNYECLPHNTLAGSYKLRVHLFCKFAFAVQMGFGQIAITGSTE